MIWKNMKILFIQIFLGEQLKILRYFTDILTRKIIFSTEIVTYSFRIPPNSMIILMGIIFLRHSLSGDAAAPPSGTLVPTAATCNANNMRTTNTTTLSSTATATQSARVAESLVVIYAIGYVTPPPLPAHCRKPPNSITGIRNHCAQTV